MTGDQNINPMDDSTVEPTLDDGVLRHRLRKDHSRIGFALLLLVCVWQGSSFFLTLLFSYIDLIRGTTLIQDAQKVFLLLNEARLFLGIAAAFLVLDPMPTFVPQKQKVSFGFVLKLLCICFAVSSACNIPNTILTNIWNTLTNDFVGNDVQTLLSGTDFWQSILFVGIVAPILEEFFFRKLLIDRLRGYGDKLAIIVSALLFGMFHMNLSQIFYAIGVGLVFGYIYCKTGKIWLSILLHGTFNLFSGVILSWFSTKLITIINELSQNMPSTITPEIVTLILTTVFALFYMSLISAATVVGVVFFIKGIKKLKWTKGALPLPSKGIVGAIIKNPGVISAIAVMSVFTILNLFL